MTEKKYLKNIRLYPHYRLWVNMMIIGPVLIPFMLFKGLNYTQILLLQSISAVAVFLFEIPTGAIADKLSRKSSLMMGSLCMALGLVIYILFRSFYFFALAEIIFGLGITFTSGADSAILYESLDRLNRKAEYQHKEGHAGSLVFIGQGLGSIVSSMLYKYSVYSPFWISVAFIMFSILLAFSFHEPDRQKSEHPYSKHVWRSIKIAITTPRLLWLILYSMLIGFALRVSFWMYQPYFVLTQIDIFWYGLIFFFFNMVAAFSSKVIGARFYEKRPRHILLMLASLMCISFILPAIFRYPFMIVILALQQIVRGMNSTTTRFYINHQVNDQERATIISVVSLAGSLGFAILSPLVGLSLDKNGTVFTYLSVGFLCITSTLCLSLFRKYQKSMKKKQAITNC